VLFTTYLQEQGLGQGRAFSICEQKIVEEQVDRFQGKMVKSGRKGVTNGIFPVPTFQQRCSHLPKALYTKIEVQTWDKPPKHSLVPNLLIQMNWDILLF
jgi:hypothetical protein